MVDTKSDLIAAKAAIGKENINILFICRFKHELEGKNDKAEVRILAITPHRIYVITTKQAPKVDFSIHILEIFSLEDANSLASTLYDTYLFQLSLTIQVGEKQLRHRFYFENEESVGKVISYIIALLRTNFLNANVDKQVTWKVSSPEKQDYVEQCIHNFTQALSPTEGQACGSFSTAYLCVCDYYKQTSEHNAEVCWDIDKIYAAHRCKDFNLDDFDRLDMKDLVPLIGALSYNTWFNRFEVSSRKLTHEVVDVIVKVVRRTLSIEEFVLQDCHLNKDHVQKIALALDSNKNKVIKRIDLSKNNIEDKGVSVLCGIFGSLDYGLEMINLSEIGMSSKGASYVANCLKNNKSMASSLSILNLSGNSLKIEGTQSLCEFLSQPNVLTELSLCNTECALDLLFTALHRGCQLSIKTLSFSGNPFFGKKSKDSSQSQSLSSLQQFFSMSRALETVNLSSTKLPASGIKAILVGLLNNPVLNDVALDISSNELKSSGAAELTSCLKEISLSKLNLANNGLEQDLIPICEGIQNNRSIKELDLSYNVTKTKNTNAIAEAMGEILIAGSPLTKLSLTDCKLRHDAAVIFDCLGTNETLTSLDIRGNGIGDMGARLLAKALQINTKLREIMLDRNNITPKGLQSITQALERNYTLYSMPLPLADLSAAIKANNSNSFLKFYSQIEQSIIRNQSSKDSTPEQAYKVHQGLLMSSIDHYTQHTDEYVIRLEHTISKLKDSENEEIQKEIEVAGKLIKEADLFRQVLLELYSDPEHSKNVLDDMFSKVTGDVMNSIECVIKDNIEKMLKSASNICPTALNNAEHLKKIKEELSTSSVIENVGISDSIMQLGQGEIAYKLCESNLLTATNIAEQLKILFIGVLQSSVDVLNTLNETSVFPELQNGQVNGESQVKRENGESLSNGDEVDVASPSTPALNLLKDISKENQFEMNWDFSKPREHISSVSSLKSEESVDSVFIQTSRNRLYTDTVLRGKKKKACSLKRRPTVYKQRSDTLEEVEIPVDVINNEITASVSESPTTHPEHLIMDESSSVTQEVDVDDIELSVLEDSMERAGVDVDMEDHSLGTPVEMLDEDNAVDEEDSGPAAAKVSRLPSMGAFDDVSSHSSQLNVRKNRVKPARGRRAPTKVAKLAHMASTDEVLDDIAEDTPNPKPRPKSEMPIGSHMLAEEVSRQRTGSEKLKREPPARPSPPTKPETPSRPEPPAKIDFSPKMEPPVRPERPKKTDLEKKPEHVKEKKVKPPAGAFQLPPLPSLGGILKKRAAPKAPDSVDGASDRVNDSEIKVEAENHSVEGDSASHDTDINESNKTPVKADGVSSTDVAPPKPPPPSIKKKPVSPSTADAPHSFDSPKSPEHTASEVPPVKPPPVKKPPRGVPLGGFGGAALMDEMNKKLHITPKNNDDEDNSPSKVASVPPKQAKPIPPQRPPSVKRQLTEGRPNVPDRPKSIQRPPLKPTMPGSEIEEKHISETDMGNNVEESLNGQAEGKKSSEESSSEASSEKTPFDGATNAEVHVTAFI